MGDESSGKVQALRAIFAEKNAPVMGMMPPHGKMTWRPPISSTEGSKEQKCDEPKFGSKVLPTLKSSSIANQDDHRHANGKSVIKPAVGPKPSHLIQSQHKVLPSVFTEKTCDNRYQKRTLESSHHSSNTRAFGETIASFMFTDNKENSESLLIPNTRTLPYEKQLKINLNESVKGKCNIDFDNYIHKRSCQVRRKELPSLEELGPAPPKPIKPVHIQLVPQSIGLSSSRTQKYVPVPQRPSYPCPLRPHTPPPLPPNPKSSFQQELEELYEDTIEEGQKRLVSLIKDELEEELYSDASASKNCSSLASEYRNEHSSNEELYQDASEFDAEEFYEIMPCDEMEDECVVHSPVYSNNKKEIEKLKGEDEKRLRREQKEKDKKDKSLEKLKKKFGITGDEIPIDDGLVKCDSRGGRGDLPVKKGETVLILRMEGNPSGRWLVKNEKGKVGYVELTNIEVDPISVKSVMSVRGFCGISGEELYCEANSKENCSDVVTVSSLRSSGSRR